MACWLQIQKNMKMTISLEWTNLIIVTYKSNEIELSFLQNNIKKKYENTKKNQNFIFLTKSFDNYSARGSSKCSIKTVILINLPLVEYKKNARPFWAVAPLVSTNSGSREHHRSDL